MLNIIFSYNRGRYLRNAVRSFEQFGEGELVIYDDDSTDTETVAVLDCAAHRHRIVQYHTPKKEYHGNLYSMMNDALTAAAIRNSDGLVQFVQDDQQWMWRNPDLEADVRRIFDAEPDALCVQNVFQKKIARHLQSQRLVRRSRDYKILGSSCCDVGIYSLNRVQRSGFRFGQSEGETERNWSGKGYQLYALAAPSVTYVPWPARIYHNGKSVFNQEMPDGDGLLMTPIGEDGRCRLSSSLDIPYLEDYSEPQGWRCVSPYWYSLPGEDYRKMVKASGDTITLVGKMEVTV